MNIDEIKSLYAEFIGFLSQIPAPANINDSLYEEEIWEQYNDSIRKLNKITGTDYNSYLIKIQQNPYYGECISLATYRTKLGGLISRLHAEYFPTLPEPFSGKPSIVINQTQQQNQQILVQLILDVQSKIDEKLPSLEEESKEKTFFQKLKGSLSATTGIVDLLNKIFMFAKDSGISTDQLQKLFS